MLWGTPAEGAGIIRGRSEEELSGSFLLKPLHPFCSYWGNGKPLKKQQHNRSRKSIEPLAPHLQKLASW